MKCVVQSQDIKLLVFKMRFYENVTVKNKEKCVFIVVCLVGLLVVYAFQNTQVFPHISLSNQMLKMRFYNNLISKSPPTHLIINTYMRSGSSFIGNIFSRRKDTFYVYEPLWKVLKFQFYNGPDQVCHYSHQECWPSDFEDSEEATDIEVGKSSDVFNVPLNTSLEFLTSIMNCTFTEDKYAEFWVDVKKFKSDFPGVKHSWKFFKSWQEYMKCAETNGTHFTDCLKLMKPVCEKANFRVSKVLRTSLDNLETLLKQVPRLKIIQSFRDPRGVINSRLHTQFYMPRIDSKTLVKQDIMTMCDRMRSDLDVARNLIKLYPGHVKIIQYEDLSDLSEKAQALYDFVGMPASDPEVTSDVSELAETGNSTTGFHPYEYRRTLDWSTIKFVDEYCSSVIKDLGYPVYQNETAYRNSADSVDSVRLPYTL